MAIGVLTVQATKEHVSRSAFGAKEQRTRKGVAVLVGCTTEECSVAKQEEDCRLRIRSTISSVFAVFTN